MPTDPHSPESDDERLEEALEESFPASDPPSVTRPHDLDPDEGEDAEKERPSTWRGG